MLVMSSYNTQYADMKYLWIPNNCHPNPNPKRAPTLTLRDNPRCGSVRTQLGSR